MKNVAFTLGLSILLLSAVCSAAAGAEAAAATELRRSATVTGNGEVYAIPDRARLKMGAEVTRPQLKDAQDEANREVRDFLVQARSLGCRDEDISTAALSIHAEYSYSKDDGSQARKLVGYHVSRGVEIVVRDLNRVGDYLKQAIDAGFNDISDPGLESSRADDLRRQALANAALNARARAEVVATTLGVKLGTIHTIEASADEGSPRPPRPLLAMTRTAAGAGGNEEMGWAGGQIRFSATVTADFDLIAP